MLQELICPFQALGTIIFFIAFVQMLYYLGVMQWLIKGLCVSPLCASRSRSS